MSRTMQVAVPQDRPTRDGRRRRALAVAVAVLGLVSVGLVDVGIAAAQDASVKVRWYCCLGTGEDPEFQVPLEQKVVDAFDASHPGSDLVFEVVTYESAPDTLATQIASGSGPDVVGPVGVGGAEAFHDQWLDLSAYVEAAGYDLSQFPESAVDIYRLGESGLGAIPFAVYPSVLFYKAELFEEAGLNPPPHRFGEPYVWPDGTETTWDYDTLRQLALKLTVDINGLDATQEGFDPTQIVQYGFEPQRDDLRGLGAAYGAGSLLAEDGKTAKVPEAWAAAWKDFYDGMWKDHTVMTQPVFQSDEFGSGEYAFFSGKVAMSNNFLWSTYGVANAGDDWDMAVLPAYQGTTTAPLNADTFRILKGTKHPEEAFEALRYLVDEGSTDLLTAYSGMPARTADQGAFFQTLQEQFPQEIDWQVATDSLAYADVPNFEAYMPRYNESVEILRTYLTKWTTTPGLDMDAEISALEAELQAAWDR